MSELIVQNQSGTLDTILDCAKRALPLLNKAGMRQRIDSLSQIEMNGVKKTRRFFSFLR